MAELLGGGDTDRIPIAVSAAGPVLGLLAWSGIARWQATG